MDARKKPKKTKNKKTKQNKKQTNKIIQEENDKQKQNKALAKTINKNNETDLSKTVKNAAKQKLKSYKINK